MEVIKKKYKYRCERCKTDVLDLDFKDFKGETILTPIPGIAVPKCGFVLVHECPVCKKNNNLNNCEAYEVEDEN